MPSAEQARLRGAVELLARGAVLAREVRHATRHAKRKLPSTTDVSFVAHNHRNTARALAAFERRHCARPNSAAGSQQATVAVPTRTFC